MINLSSTERKVFKALSQVPAAVAHISRKAHVPRMTAYTVLLRLQKSKLVTTVNSVTGKKKLWVKVDDSVLLRSFDAFKKNYIPSVVQSSHKEELKIYQGKEEIGDALMGLTKRKDGARMFSIQSSQNFPLWIKVMGKEWVNKHNRAVVEHKLITLTIHSKHVPELITREKDVVDSYKGRLGNSHSIDEEFLIKGLSFYIFDDVIFLVNLNTVEASLIERKDLSLFLKSMFLCIFSKSEQELFFKQFGR